MMRILDIQPQYGPSAIACFDVELSEHLRLYNLVLRRTPDGRTRTYAPNAAGKHVATFHPILAQQITDAAVAALNGRAAYGHR